MKVNQGERQAGGNSIDFIRHHGQNLGLRNFYNRTKKKNPHYYFGNFQSTKIYFEIMAEGINNSFVVASRKLCGLIKIHGRRCGVLLSTCISRPRAMADLHTSGLTDSSTFFSGCVIFFSLAQSRHFTTFGP